LEKKLLSFNQGQSAKYLAKTEASQKLREITDMIGIALRVLGGEVRQQGVGKMQRLRLNIASGLRWLEGRAGVRVYLNHDGRNAGSG
jgi:hypothetical protein